MRTRFALAVFVLIASPALAQTAPSRPQAPQAPQPPSTPVQAAAPANLTPPPPPPAPPGPPRREGQPINVKVELTITEESGGMSSKKTVSAVIGDGFSGYVRANGIAGDPNSAPLERFVPLNLDAYPVILSNGKIRLTCTIQYLAGAAQYIAGAASTPGGPASQNQRARTDIKENIVLILESGKSLVVSQAADPVSDRQVTVEVKATILR
jgi:hypothetical protein